MDKGADRGELLLPRSAFTWKVKDIAGVSPRASNQVTVPGTDLITVPFSKITYLSGVGPEAGPAHLKDTELVVELSGVSPVGRKTGGLPARLHAATPTVPPSSISSTSEEISHVRLFGRTFRAFEGGIPGLASIGGEIREASGG
jgi:hypothetical protein